MRSSSTIFVLVFAVLLFVTAQATAQIFILGQTLEPRYSIHAALADIDGDGDSDLGLANYSYTSIYLNEDGIFSHKVDIQKGGFAVAFADIDGDGDPDMACSSVNGTKINIFLNDGNGNFSFLNAFDGNSTDEIVFTDLNGDNSPDLIGGGERARVYFNDGSGNFELTQTIEEINLVSVAVGDIDGDGDIDAVFGRWPEWVPGFNEVYFNDGTGYLELSQTLETRGTHDITLGDIDGDGDLDIVAGSDEYVVDGSFAPVLVFSNDGEGNFTLTQEVGEYHTHAVKLADVDNDGDLDLIEGNSGPQPNRLYLNDGEGNFTEYETIGDYRTNDLVLEDLDDDGDLDLIEATWYNYNGNGPGNTYIYYNSPTGLEEKNFVVRYNFKLFQCQPNPFAHSTLIRYQLPTAEYVEIDIYNIAGQLVKRLVSEKKEAGQYRIRWDAKNKNGRQISSGTYFLRIQSGEFSQTRKLIVVK